MGNGREAAKAAAWGEGAITMAAGVRQCRAMSARRGEAEQAGGIRVGAKGGKGKGNGHGKRKPRKRGKDDGQRARGRSEVRAGGSDRHRGQRQQEGTRGDKKRKAVTPEVAARGRGAAKIRVIGGGGEQAEKGSGKDGREGIQRNSRMG